jgi:hypothetical protein
MRKDYSEFGENPNLDNAELTPTDIAWLAGIFDGEGSLCFYRCKKRNVIGFNITNTNLLLLEKARKILSTITGKEFRIYAKKFYKPRTFKNNKQVYDIECHNYRHQYRILKTLLPYLTSKKQKAEEGILYLEVRRKELVESSNTPASKQANELFEKIMRRGVTTERVAPITIANPWILQGEATV